MFKTGCIPAHAANDILRHGHGTGFGGCAGQHHERGVDPGESRSGTLPEASTNSWRTWNPPQGSLPSVYAPGSRMTSARHAANPGYTPGGLPGIRKRIRPEDPAGLFIAMPVCTTPLQMPRILVKSTIKSRMR